jgi:hypothetical protein
VWEVGAGDWKEVYDMNSEKPDAKLIFGEAWRLTNPAERAAYLDQEAEAVSIRKNV